MRWIIFVLRRIGWIEGSAECIKVSLLDSDESGWCGKVSLMLRKGHCGVRILVIEWCHATVGVLLYSRKTQQP